MDLVGLGLEWGQSAQAALEVMTEVLERYGQDGSGHNGVDDPYWSSFLVAERGDAWVLETSGREWAVERVERVRAISNRTTIPAFDAAHRELGLMRWNLPLWTCMLSHQLGGCCRRDRPRG